MSIVIKLDFFKNLSINFFFVKTLLVFAFKIKTIKIKIKNNY